jgi:TolA-binding protein
MRREQALIPLAILAASCGTDPKVGERFRAERDLWRLDAEYRVLAGPAERGKTVEWERLAGEYLRIADRHKAAIEGSTDADRQASELVAHAMFTAAQAYSIARDSLEVDRIYQQMSRFFERVPNVAADVAIARGRIAEGRGSIREAVELYQAAVDVVTPDPDAAGTAGTILQYPLRIARLLARTSPNGPTEPFYARARAYYQRMANGSLGEKVRAESLGLLAEAAGDLGNWADATRMLSALEAELRNQAHPVRDPASVRLAIAGIQRRSGAGPETVHETLSSIIRDYPESKLDPEVWIRLAETAVDRGRMREAIGHLDDIVQKYPDDEQAVSDALLTKGRILEQNDHWPEALETYRTLSFTHPISEPALWVPLEIAGHYARANDKKALKNSLQEAERTYRDFISRYPPGQRTVFAHERLVQTLMLQQSYDSTVTEMVKLGEDLVGTRRGVDLMIGAAGIACFQEDTSKAVGILERLGQLYTNADVGTWAQNEADRLRGTTRQ